MTKLIIPTLQILILLFKKVLKSITSLKNQLKTKQIFYNLKKHLTFKWKVSILLSSRTKISEKKKRKSKLFYLSNKKNRIKSKCRQVKSDREGRLVLFSKLFFSLINQQELVSLKLVLNVLHKFLILDARLHQKDKDGCKLSLVA